VPSPLRCSQKLLPLCQARDREVAATAQCLQKLSIALRPAGKCAADTENLIILQVRCAFAFPPILSREGCPPRIRFSIIGFICHLSGVAFRACYIFVLVLFFCKEPFYCIQEHYSGSGLGYCWLSRSCRLIDIICVLIDDLLITPPRALIARR